MYLLFCELWSKKLKFTYIWPSFLGGGWSLVDFKGLLGSDSEDVVLDSSVQKIFPHSFS